MKYGDLGGGQEVYFIVAYELAFFVWTITTLFF
jgi:hypothetical protein